MFRIVLIGLCAAMFIGSANAADAPADPPTPEEFFSPPRLKEAVLSPEGRYLALIRRSGFKDAVVVIDLEERKTTIVFQDPAHDDVTIASLHWKGEDRLVFRYSGRTFRREADGTPATRSRSGSGRYGVITDSAFGLYTAKRTGGPATNLGSVTFFHEFPSDPAAILVTDGYFYRGRASTTGSLYTLIYRINLETGDRVEIERAGPNTIGWEADREGRTFIRYDVYGRRGGLRVYGRSANDDWAELFSIRERDLRSLPDLEILGLSPEAGKLYVAVKPEAGAAGDTRELRAYDVARRSMGPKLWSHPKYDLDGILVEGRDQTLAAMCYWADVYACDFVDPARQLEFAALATFFDGQRSIRVTSESRDTQRQILLVSGPDEPSSFYLFDRRYKKVELLGARRPRLDPNRLGIMTRYAFNGRDGTPLNAYVTEPPRPPAGKLPLIVLPHGGPEARDYFDFQPWVQAFAGRGYLVLQPNFRGSGGLGAAFGAQGYGQWGLRMQDDVMDGVRSLIASGRVDPDRICIVGASYGGYVALYAGAREAELFRCVVSVAGVSDLVAIQNWERREGGADSPRYRYWLKSIGDPVIDRDRLTATSPITYADRFRAPVLLLHGQEDDIVPVEQSRVMEAALKRAGRDVRLVEYEFAGHNDWTSVTEVAVLTEMLAFVDKAIGPNPAASAPPPTPSP